MIKKILLLSFSLLFLMPIITNAETSLCIIDNKDHGDKVQKFAENHYKGNIIRMDIEQYAIVYKNANKDSAFSKCDVVNYSWNNSIEDYHNPSVLEVRKREYKVIKDLLDSYDGFIISSSGNTQNDDLFEAPIARFKEVNKILGINEYNDRIYSIGQLEKLKNGYENHSTSGEFIEFYIDNYNDEIEGVKRRGTSYASAVTSGVIAELLLRGVDKKDINNSLKFKQGFDSNGLEYKILDIEKTLEVNK